MHNQRMMENIMKIDTLEFDFQKIEKNLKSPPKKQFFFDLKMLLFNHFQLWGKKIVFSTLVQR